MKYRIYSEEEKNAFIKENGSDIIDNTIEESIKFAKTFNDSNNYNMNNINEDEYNNDIMNSEDETWNRAK